MNRLRLYLLITFVGSFLVISVECGIYFFTENRLEFTNGMNLALALVFGLGYVAGAMVSHRLAERLTEKGLLLMSNVVQFLLHGVLTFWPNVWTLFIAVPLLAIFVGMQWPVVESYVSAGHGADKQQRVVGIFNLSWSLAIPLNLLTAGVLIEKLGSYFFLLPAILNVVVIGLIVMIPTRPRHMEESDPLQLSAPERRKLTHHLAAARWLMLLSYVGMFVLRPVMPNIFNRLSIETSLATGLSSLVDVARIAIFLVMAIFIFWRGRRSLILIALPLLPISFFMVLFGNSLTVVLIGEAVFGAAGGMVYFASLYYAQAVRNAAVQAGGAHEALIGSGFAIGPLAGLVGLGLAKLLGSEIAGTLLILGPLFLLGSVASLVSLYKPLPTPESR